MASDENVAIMRRAYGAFSTGNINTLTELWKVARGQVRDRGGELVVGRSHCQSPCCSDRS
jgi:hypothetical protein